MAEYIERAPLVGTLTSSDAQATIRAMTGEEAYAYFLRLVNTAPTADVAPVRHGWWDDSYDGITPYCSVCGRSHRLMVRTPGECPNCCAKMDGVRHDDDYCSHGERSDGKTVLGV